MMNKKKTSAYMGGGMAKKKKPMASTGYKEGGTVKKKKETFGQAFKRNRKKFMNSGSAADYTFKHNGKSYNILQKGETKAGVMKKFSAPKTSVRPKLRPGSRTAPPISANTKKKIEETVRKVANTDSKARPSRPRTEKTEQQKRNEINRRNKERQLGIPLARGIGASSFAGKGAGKDKPKAKPTRKADGVPARLREKTTDGLPKGIGGMLNRKDEPGAPFLGSKGGKSAALRRKDVKEGQAKYRDRTGPQSRARNVTYAEWKGMSRAKRKMLGLPVSVAGGELGFKRFRKGLTGKEYTMRTNK